MKYVLPDTDIVERLDGNIVNLDHLNFAVESHTDLVETIRILNEHHVPHGEVNDLSSDVGMYILAFRHPDNIQLELTAPFA